MLDHYLFSPEDIIKKNLSSQCGGKALALATLYHSPLYAYIPPWYVLIPQSFYDSLTHNQLEQLQQITSADSLLETMQTIFENLTIHPQIEQALLNTLPQLSDQETKFAIRSSALEEDNKNYSFAGQLKSFLYIPFEQMIEKIKAVWYSGFSQEVIAYRQQKGLSLLPKAPAVIIQTMVNADISGVAFSANPITGERTQTVINAIYGLGEGLVSGELDADQYIINRAHQIIKTHIAEKKEAYYQDNISYSKQSIATEKINQAALDQTQIKTIQDLVQQCEQYFHTPQDIEWAIADNQLYLLQSRPITHLENKIDPEAKITLWDNSNIAENYSGVTTPLTFSFAKHIYAGVYHELCRILGVAKPILRDLEPTFQQMLGLLKGRIYYNLLSWFQVLAVLPGYKMNRRFMEQMMGVKEGVPDAILDQLNISSSNPLAKLLDMFRFINTILSLLWRYILLSHTKKAFYKRLKLALAPPLYPFQQQRLDELALAYRNLEKQLITRWDAPLLNDFFAMIFFGILGKQLEKQYGTEGEKLKASLIIARGEMISAQPAKHIISLAQLAKPHPELVHALQNDAFYHILPILEKYPEFNQAYQNYINTFADRCLDELKLESPTLEDDPSRLLHSIGELASYNNFSQENQNNSLQQRQNAENIIKQDLKNKPIKKAIFFWILHNVRTLLRDRENLRFERTRVFGRVRRLFTEIGNRLYSLDYLENPKDIFYLELSEILNFIEGTATLTHFKDLVRLRQQTFREYQNIPELAERLQTYGSPYQAEQILVSAQADSYAIDTEQHDYFQGIGCASGIVTGSIKIIKNPQEAKITPGHIILAERTDPGWVMLFPLCKGLLIEHGSPLSHVAIVAREMGLPTITGLRGISQQLKEGDYVRINGETGIVELLHEKPS